MESRRLDIMHDRRIQVASTIVAMLISMYLPYQRSLSYVYQIAIVGIVILFCGACGYAVMPLLILSTTRSYIAVSTQSEFANYLGLNGDIMFIIMLLLLFFVLKRLEFKIYIKNGVWSIALLAMLFLLSRMWAINTTEYGAYFNAICLIYIALPFLIETEEDIFISKVSFTLAGFFAGIGIIPHLLNMGTIYEFSVSVDRNYQSCFLLMCILQTVALLMQAGKKFKLINKIACFVVIAMDAYIIITSASRSAFIAMGIAVAVYLLFNLKHYKKFFMAIIICSIVITFLYEIGLFDFVLERFTLSNASTANGRTDIWQDYIHGFFSSNPLQILLGHGLVGQTNFGFVAHNIFISILYSFGIIGFLLLIITLVSCMYNFVKNKEYQELISLIPIIFMCCTVEPYYRIEFAIYLAVMVGTSKYYALRRINNYENEIV